MRLARCPGPALLAHLYHGHQTRSARAEDREGDRAVRVSPTKRDTRGRTQSIAGRAASMSRRSATEREKDPAAFSWWITKVSSRSGNGTPPASGPLAGRRLLVGFLLLSLARLPA